LIPFPVTPATRVSTLSLHDALPILFFFSAETACLTRLTDRDAAMAVTPLFHGNAQFMSAYPALLSGARFVLRSRFSASRWIDQIDRKSTRLNSSHVKISYAVFCLKK